MINNIITRCAVRYKLPNLNTQYAIAVRQSPWESHACSKDVGMQTYGYPLVLDGLAERLSKV
jgi:hypothetical protein